MNMKPAIVEYCGTESDEFTPGRRYQAFFLEYWEGNRNSLHVRGNDGLITDFNLLEDFVIISDEDHVLNTDEATVLCLTHIFDESISAIKYGKEYKAIGRDKDGLYLVEDESGCCYFYSSVYFRVLQDEHGILERQSVYYSYNGGKGLS